MKAPEPRPALADLLSPEDLTLLEATLDEVLREQLGPDRYETYTRPRPLSAGLTPLPLLSESPVNVAGFD